MLQGCYRAFISTPVAAAPAASAAAPLGLLRCCHVSCLILNVRLGFKAQILRHTAAAGQAAAASAMK
jgi:hypothetical protein